MQVVQENLRISDDPDARRFEARSVLEQGYALAVLREVGEAKLEAVRAGHAAERAALAGALVTQQVGFELALEIRRAQDRLVDLFLKQGIVIQRA